MMPAVKHFDPIMGVDIHILIIPMVGPVPIPHPHVAMVMDPMDFIPVIGATVMVGVMRRGTAGTAGKTIPHIPLGAPFAKPPMNESEIFMGSAMVLADGAPMSFTALPVLTCHDIGMIAPPRKKPKKTYGMVLPTSIVTAIPAGLPVLVGGPPTIDMMAMAMAGGMKALGGAMGKLRKLQKSSKRMKKFSDAVHKKVAKKMDDLGVPPNVRNKVHKGVCSITGHPVDIAAGKLFTDEIDFELPGPLPIKWERTWFSTSVYRGPLGHGWHHCYDVALALAEKGVAIRMADGRPVAFPSLEVGEAAFHRAEQLTLIRDSRGYALDTADGIRYRFFNQAAHNGHYLLQSITEKTLGSTLRFAYSSQAELIEITDSVGRFIRFENDDKGRIKKILLPTPDADSVDNFFCAVEYHYRDGELIAAADALNNKTQYRYEHQLLVQETLKSGLSFYFKFDGKDHHARCTETWGDGEIYYRKLEYDTEEKITKVYNSLGHLTVYHHDGVLPHQITNPRGFVSYIEYNDYAQITAEINELGQKSQYEYDDFGNLISEIRPGGAVNQFAYDEQQNLVAITNAVGSVWRYQYDPQGRLISEIDPLQRQTKYRFNDSALVGIADPDGNQFTLYYDVYGNVRCIQDQTGTAMNWQFDQLGNMIISTDAKGNQRKFSYDLLGRIVRIREPDDSERTLTHDAMGNLVRTADQQLVVEFQYAGMNRLIAQSQGGTSVHFDYDTEENLTGIRNEAGRQYQFKYNAMDELVVESGFDDLIREYYRDPLGRVSRIQRPGGRFSECQYDEYGYLRSVKNSDGSLDEFAYRADGFLMAANNACATVTFERNALGMVTKESLNDVWVSSEFDSANKRVRINSSLGLDQLIKRNEFGEVESIAALNQRFKVDIHRDSNGLEVARTMPGGISSRWQRDKIGRPFKQEIFQGQKAFNSKCYEWGFNDRLAKVVDARLGQTTFTHDHLGNLIAATYGDHSVELRSSDPVGNVFRSAAQNDRIYGRAGQLLSTIDATRSDTHASGHYQYDPEGNLTSKSELDGKTWRYQWSNAGMLRKVIRPDDQEVIFEYDPLGRRISKRFQGKVVRWTWDGNNPLHEWQEPVNSAKVTGDSADNTPAPPRSATQTNTAGTSDALTTWLFDPDTYSPMAKLVGDQCYSIVADYQGVPQSMFDDNGVAVWSAEMGIWGDLRNLQYDQQTCPFRWPGQYHDEETGLYYNRFRYYDPNAGQYISQDPIRLHSGVYDLYRYVGDPTAEYDPLGLDWNYVLTDASGDPYYHGRASDKQTMSDVARRHSNTKGTDGARFGPGDTMSQITAPGTDPDAVRGIEQRGTEQKPLLGRGSDKARGNKINGMSEAKQKTARGRARLTSGDNLLNGRKPSEMPALKKLKAKTCQ